MNKHVCQQSPWPGYKCIQISRKYDPFKNVFDWFNDLFNPDKPKKGKKIKTQLFYKSSSKPYKKISNITQQKIDDLLDKINQRGYNSLTEDEKEILRRASKEDLL